MLLRGALQGRFGWLVRFCSHLLPFSLHLTLVLTLCEERTIGLWATFAHQISWVALQQPRCAIRGPLSVSISTTQEEQEGRKAQAENKGGCAFEDEGEHGYHCPTYDQNH